MPGPEDVRRRLEGIRQRMAAASRRCGRNPEDVVLVGASKRQTLARMQAAHDAGLRVFGENQVQEAETKRPRLPGEIEWHLIGPLQSNKVKRAVQLFDVVHSLDRVKIALALEREGERQGKQIRGFLEVNLGDEPTKHGFSPRDLALRVRSLAQLEHLQVVGLMAIPPRSDDVSGARQWFRKLRQLRDQLAQESEWRRFPGLLSMGMSEDFETAIEEGATHVRVGSALFGPRPGG